MRRQITWKDLHALMYVFEWVPEIIHARLRGWEDGVKAEGGQGMIVQDREARSHARSPAGGWRVGKKVRRWKHD